MTAKREIERRYLTHEIEWRVDANAASPGHLVGYASKFDKRSQDLGGFVEVVDRAAFNKSIGDNVRVLCRFNHKDDGLLGTTDAGTLTISVDDIGLRYDVSLPNTSVGRDVAILAGRGDLRNSSFAFECMDESWGITERGFPERRVLAARLVDVAPVVNPAYLDSTTALRSLADHLGVELDFVKTRSADELRDLLTTPMVGMAGVPGANSGALPDVDLSEIESPEDVEVESTQQNSLTDTTEQRDTHSERLAIWLRMEDLEAKR